MRDITTIDVLNMDKDACERWMDSLRVINRADQEELESVCLRHFMYGIIAVVAMVGIWAWVGATPWPVLVLGCTVAGASFGSAVQSSHILITVRSWEQLLSDEMHGRPKPEPPPKHYSRHMRLIFSRRAKAQQGEQS